MRALDLGSAEQVEQDLFATPCRNAEEEVQRILRVQRNYYTVLKVTQELGTVFDAATSPNQFCLCKVVWQGFESTGNSLVLPGSHSQRAINQDPASQRSDIGPNGIAGEEGHPSARDPRQLLPAVQARQ